MHPDVVDLRAFYASPLGHMARRLVARLVRTRWERCTGQSLLGVGYATPFLDVYRSQAVRVLAFMPAEQGVVNWPTSGLSASALVEASMMPLPDGCIDRVVLVHALETSEHPRELLSEVWRILTPGGRLIAIVPNRRGLWSGVDATPFGSGQPFSRYQLREILRDTLFLPVHWGEALYMPPFAWAGLLRLAPAVERIGARLSLPFAGVHLVEATKQLYRPVPIRKRLRSPIPQLQPVPVLAPSPRLRVHHEESELS